MSDYTVQIDLPDHKRGDRWPGINAIGPVIINGAQPAATLTRIRMWFKSAAGAKFKLDSDPAQDRNAPITISNPTTWYGLIPGIEDFLPTAGDWSWDMEFYQTGNTSPLTLYKGVITVVDDVTK
jgi:hypothetical protein